MTAAKLFADAWNAAASLGAPALFATGIAKIPYKELTDAIEREDAKFISEFVHSFYTGTIYIFTEAFNPADVVKLKDDAFAWGQKQESNEPRIVSRVPDYRSRRDWHSEDRGFGYSSVYDMMHFFRWNDDPIQAFKLFEPKYRVLRTISGYGADEIKNNLPDDGIIDRAEISHYPPGIGGIAFHSDPIQATRFLFTLNLNRFGVDYHVGGFAVGTKDGKILRIDPEIEVGSLTGFLPTVCHGVEVIDPHLPPTRDSIAGRWYGAISMVTTHTVKDRSYTRPVAGYPTLRKQIEQAMSERENHVSI